MFTLLAASIPAEQQDKSRFCVWVTSEPCEQIPHFLLQNLHKVAWNHMISPGADDTGDHILPSLHHISPEGYLKSGGSTSQLCLYLYKLSPLHLTVYLNSLPLHPPTITSQMKSEVKLRIFQVRMVNTFTWHIELYLFK